MVELLLRRDGTQKRARWSLSRVSHKCPFLQIVGYIHYGDMIECLSLRRVDAGDIKESPSGLLYISYNFMPVSVWECDVVMPCNVDSKNFNCVETACSVTSRGLTQSTMPSDFTVMVQVVAWRAHVSRHLIMVLLCLGYGSSPWNAHAHGSTSRHSFGNHVSSDGLGLARC